MRKNGVSKEIRRLLAKSSYGLTIAQITDKMDVEKFPVSTHDNIAVLICNMRGEGLIKSEKNICTECCRAAAYYYLTDEGRMKVQTEC